jgi:hypothetical protein
VVPLVLLASACGTRMAGVATSTDARAATIDAQIGRMRLDSATVYDLSAERTSLEAAYNGAQKRRLRATAMGETGFVSFL